MSDLDALDLFAAVARHGSFASAARQRDIPTTTLSRKVQQLEQRLGGRLFNRTTRSLSLTELGERILPKAQLISETLDDVRQDAEQLATEPTGTLHISASRALSQGILASLLSDFRRHYPAIAVSVDVSNRYQDLAASGLDFAFRVGPLEDSSQVARSLGEVAYVLVATPALIRESPTLSTPQQLAQWPCIQTHIAGRHLPWRFEREEQTVEVAPPGCITVDDLHAAGQFAIEGQGVAFLPAFVVRDALMRGQLAVLLPEWTRQSRQLYLVYPERNYLPRKSQAFIDYIRQRERDIATALDPLGKANYQVSPL